MHAGVTFANFRGSTVVEADRNASAVLVESRFLANTVGDGVLTGVHGSNFQGSTVVVERCASACSHLSPLTALH